MGRGMGEHGGKPPYPDNRMTEQRGLSARHAPSTVPSSSHPALGQRPKGFGLPWGCAPYPDTRMAEWRGLSVRHAPPQTSLSDGACSPAPAESRTRMDEWWNLPVPHPIDRKAGLAISARTVGRRFAREDMLSHRLPATFILEWQDFETCRPRIRRRQSFCQKIQAIPAPALRTHSLPALFYH